jgi:hypothetical protein
VSALHHQAVRALPHHGNVLILVHGARALSSSPSCPSSGLPQHCKASSFQTI